MSPSNSLHVLTKKSSSKFHVLVIIPLYSISAVNVCMVWGHPLEHGKPTSNHILKKRTILLQLETTHSSSVGGNHLYHPLWFLNFKCESVITESLLYCQTLSKWLCLSRQLVAIGQWACPHKEEDECWHHISLVRMKIERKFLPKSRENFPQEPSDICTLMHSSDTDNRYSHFCMMPAKVKWLSSFLPSLFFCFLVSFLTVL